MKDHTITDEQFGTIKKRKTRYWIWILVGSLVFIVVLSWVNRKTPPVEIPQGRFTNMVSQRAIKKIVLVKNEMIVEVTLKPEYLRNAVYRSELERHNSPFGIEPNGPHYQMLIASVDKFYRDYEQATKSTPLESIVDVQVEVRNDVTGMLINWLFLGLIIFGIVMIIRSFTRR